MSKFVAVIMAGGKGQRFWPLSTVDKPKQFLDLERSGRTLIQTTFERVLPLVDSPEDIFVATAERYVDLVQTQLDIPSENLIIEPVGRDSAPAVALASLTVHERYPNAVVGFFSSDHRVGEPAAFRNVVTQAAELAEAENGLVTIGIQPTRPATGYGYIRAGEAVSAGFRVAEFVEKPNAVRAQLYLEEGGYSWNAGIFVWSAQTILEELDAYAGDLMVPLREAFAAGNVAEVFPTLKKISIDYAVMEHTDKAFVVPGDFGWDDIGDWVALERLLKRDRHGFDKHSNDTPNPNTVVGTHVGLETEGNIIYTEDGSDVIVTLGVENLVIVKRGNAVLVIHKDRVQDIKALLNDERLEQAVV